MPLLKDSQIKDNITQKVKNNLMGWLISKDYFDSLGYQA